MSRPLAALALALLLTPTLLADGPAAGVWKGTYSITESGCPNLTFTGDTTWLLFQEGPAVNGAIVLTNTPREVTNCIATGQAIEGGDVSGSVFDGVFKGRIVFDKRGGFSVFDFSAQLNENSLTVEITAGARGRFTLARVTAPALDGFYRGSYSFTATLGCGSIAYNGVLDGPLFQFNQILVGRFEMSGIKDVRPDCSFFLEPPLPTFFGGLLTGNLINGRLEIDGDEDGDDAYDVQATAGGNGISGILRQPIGQGPFVIQKAAPRPSIGSFFAKPQRIRPGETARLVWSTSNARSVTIDQGVGQQRSDGFADVSPSVSTTYTLTANGQDSIATAATTIVVITEPLISISLFPSAMIQVENSGGGGTRYAVKNVGGGSTTITLAQNGAFFTQAPQTFPLAPRETQIITVTSTPQPAGVYRGTALLSGAGVPEGLVIPLGLLSALAPEGTVIAVPVAKRVDTSGPPQSSPTGSIVFANRGTAPLVGVLTSDVPWIVPQSGIVMIPPGSFAAVTFAIDRSRRPDAGAIRGSALGRMSLTYLRGTSGGGKGGAPFSTSSSTTSSTISIVDNSSVGAVPTQPPPLADGEVAYFVPGITTSGSALVTSDVTISNLSAAGSASGVTAFYTAAGASTASSLKGSLPSIPATEPLALFDVLKSLFSVTGQTGTMQIRGSSVANLSVDAELVSSRFENGTVGTLLPVFSSNVAARSLESMFLPGLRNDAIRRANLTLQETSGGTVTLATEFFDADGRAVGASRSDKVESFRILSIRDALPAGAVSARVSLAADSTGSAVAYATIDERIAATGELAAVVDWSQYSGFSPSEPIAIPLAVRGAVRRRGAAPTPGDRASSRTALSIMNITPANASGVLEFHGNSGLILESPLELAPMQTRSWSDVVSSLFAAKSTPSGVLVFRATSGEFALSARIDRGNGFESTLPVVPLSDGLGVGDVRRISGLSDSTLEMVTNRDGGTFRTDFGLFETAGRDVTIRVTLSYIYPAGSTVAARDAISKDYSIRANSSLFIARVTRELLGESRDSTFGEMRNLELEFTVTSGDGAIIPFVITTDNGSGDANVRVE